MEYKNNIRNMSGELAAWDRGLSPMVLATVCWAGRWPARAPHHFVTPLLPLTPR
jgi:hypothetical protein